MAHMFDLFTEQDLDDALAARLVNIRYDKDPFYGIGLRILNYSDAAVYTPGAWDNPAVRQCRGLIVDSDGTLVARSWAKFFNHGQPEAGDLDLTAPVEVTDKMDGSLGVVHYDTYGDPRVATRGSFTSDQAIHATRLLYDRYPNWRRWDPVITPLVEIIYPSNRIVCDYGDLDDLILLGGVHRDTGAYYGPQETANITRWPGPVVETLTYTTLGDALAAEPRPGMEGFCVRYLHEPRIVKIKQTDYMRLHAILTNTSARNLWEAAAVHECKYYITNPLHWGSYLGIGPDRAAEVLAMGDDWETRILDGVPDEFLTWVQSTLLDVYAAVANSVDEAVRLSAQVAAEPDKRTQFGLVKDHVMQKEILWHARTGERRGVELRAWREANPGPIRPFARDEAVA